MKKLVIGILAHVDAGKTTLSEAMLYESGSIRKMGRVDNGDAFLDTDAMEKERGITIFSKQAVFSYGDMEIALLDTPGHMDFSAEMERTLQVLDYGILVINGADGVEGHTETLWRLLKRYGVPVFLFVNKMDQAGTDKEALLACLKEKLSDVCVDFSEEETGSFYENIAMSDEKALEQFLEKDRVREEDICQLIYDRKLFPCFFGSALRKEGVDRLLGGVERYAVKPAYPEEFGARVFKIARDAQGNRLTYLKVTGGSLKVKDTIKEEKVNQIRIYSGERYETAGEAPAGSVCAVTGLTTTFPGEGLGREQEAELPVLEPVLTYRVILPPETDAAVMLSKLRLLEEEEPQLHIVWDKDLQEIQVRIMGEVQMEILQRMVKDRFGIVIEFGQGSVLYRETIAEPVIGVGHFEPLKHYAEVHLLLEPGEPGSGMQFTSACSEEVLAKNWQRLVLTHLEEKEHCGVLLGAPITDMKITLLAGRAHLKHTEGGDFRQATYRAVRQGLMEAPAVLLEPYYAFRLEIPEKGIGRAMTDIERMGGSVTLPQIAAGKAVLTGQAPVAAMRDYQKEVRAYTQGEGRLSCTLDSYRPCHNTEEVLKKAAYDPDSDLHNPSGSVFCAHGAGFVVAWDQVKAHMHLDVETEEYLAAFSQVQAGWRDDESKAAIKRKSAAKTDEQEIVLGTEEIDRILERTFYANRRGQDAPRKGIYRRKPAQERTSEPISKNFDRSRANFAPYGAKKEYLLVDGYNVIFAWEDLQELAKVNIDSARGKLLDVLCDYQAVKGCELIVVFDAYRVQGHATEVQDYHNIHVVYTKEAETADRYIEKFAHENGKKYRVTVATSDGLEQIIIRGQGCFLLSSRELKEEVERTRDRLREEYLEAPGEKGGRYYLMDGFKSEEP